jgi:hypothetical protein
MTQPTSRTSLAMLCFLTMVIGCSSTDNGPSNSFDDEEGDVEVTLAQCPPAVQTTIKNQVGSGSIDEIERSPSGNYEVDATGANGSFEFVVAGDGTYLGPEDEDDDDMDDDD